MLQAVGIGVGGMMVGAGLVGYMGFKSNSDYLERGNNDSLVGILIFSRMGQAASAGVALLGAMVIIGGSVITGVATRTLF